jgi:hypothetical protein
LFATPPLVEFRPSMTRCPSCGCELKVHKTRIRTVSTLHVGQFRAREVFLNCRTCGHTCRSEELCALVPPGANFGYDVMVYAGKALLLRHRNEEEAVAELARRNISISPRSVSLLGNVKMPTENEKHIVPLLQRIKEAYGIPLALVHDMGKGILSAVATVFPEVPDFICHFHFLRDIGKDFLGAEYDTIRKRLRKHGIGARLCYRAKYLKADMDRYPELIQALETSIENARLPVEARQFMPILNVYTLIQWTLNGKSEGHGYGFPFDHPHLVFAKRIRRLHCELEKLQTLQLRGEWEDNKPYFKIYLDLAKIMSDRTLWKTVEAIEEKRRSPSLRNSAAPCVSLQTPAARASMTRDRKATSAPSRNV